MKLEALGLQQCQQVREWRNSCLETLRTPYLLTADMQYQFFRQVVCDRNSPHRYWAMVLSYDEPAPDVDNPLTTAVVCRPPVFIGMGGLTHIDWYNRNAEISLIIDPKLQGKGYGEQAVELLLDAAFNQLDLNCVYGECYEVNKALSFWETITQKYNGNMVTLRDRKFWGGRFWYGLYFDILKDEFERTHSAIQPS